MQTNSCRVVSAGGSRKGTGDDDGMFRPVQSHEKDAAAAAGYDVKIITHLFVLHARLAFSRR